MRRHSTSFASSRRRTSKVCKDREPPRHYVAANVCFDISIASSRPSVHGQLRKFKLARHLRGSGGRGPVTPRQIGNLRRAPSPRRRQAAAPLLRAAPAASGRLRRSNAARSFQVVLPSESGPKAGFGQQRDLLTKGRRQRVSGQSSYSPPSFRSPRAISTAARRFPSSMTTR